MTEAAPADAAAQTASTLAATEPPAQITYYAQYCFHLSPTLNRWCPMRVADVVRLDQFADFEGQNVFFHLNHPIKWVRVAGVVIACAEYYGRRVYTVDDGSGAVIECAVPTPAPPPRQPQVTGQTNPAAGRATDNNIPTINNPGVVVEVLGALRTYRSALQVHVTKLAILRGTEQEVQLWTEVAAFVRDTLHRPWLLDRRTVRTCRKAAMESRLEREEEKIRREEEDERNGGASRRGR